MFVSTMAFPVVDAFLISSKADARERLLFVQDTELLRLDLEELDRFWQAWDSGIQQLSEILMTNGFW